MHSILLILMCSKNSSINGMAVDFLPIYIRFWLSTISNSLIGILCAPNIQRTHKNRQEKTAMENGLDFMKEK